MPDNLETARETRGPAEKTWRRRLAWPPLNIVLRILLGSTFVLSGWLKLTRPPEEFAAIIREYQMLPESLLLPLAQTLPWFELAAGAYVILGLFTTYCAGFITAMLLGFVVILCFTLARGINLEDCGCFGSLGYQESLGETLVRDLVLLLIAAMVLGAREHRWSLDRLFSRWLGREK